MLTRCYLCRSAAKNTRPSLYLRSGPGTGASLLRPPVSASQSKGPTSNRLCGGRGSPGRPSTRCTQHSVRLHLRQTRRWPCARHCYYKPAAVTVPWVPHAHVTPSLKAENLQLRQSRLRPCDPELRAEVSWPWIRVLCPVVFPVASVPLPLAGCSINPPWGSVFCFPGRAFFLAGLFSKLDVGAG